MRLALLLAAMALVVFSSAHDLQSGMSYAYV